MLKKKVILLSKIITKVKQRKKQKIRDCIAMKIPQMFAKVTHSHNYHMGKGAKCSLPKIFCMPFLADAKYALFCNGIPQMYNHS